MKKKGLKFWLKSPQNATAAWVKHNPWRSTEGRVQFLAIQRSIVLNIIEAVQSVLRETVSDRTSSDEVYIIRISPAINSLN